MNVVYVVAPLYGEGRRWRWRLGRQTGGATMCRKRALRECRDVTQDMFGRAQRISITRQRTAIIGPGGTLMLYSSG